MQRTVGNQVVVHLLNQSGSSLTPNIQRSTLDDKATEVERAGLQVLTLEHVAVPSGEDLRSLFKAKSPRWSLVDDVQFSPNIDDKVKPGLEEVAAHIYDPKSFSFNTVTNVPLDLHQFGGVDGVYRFTLIERKAKPKKQLIIEQVSSKPPPDLTQIDMTNAEKRFHSYDFTAGSGFTGDENKKHLYAALARIPESTLGHVKGLTFVLHAEDTGPKDEPGDYDPNTHTINLYKETLRTFASSADAGGADWFTFALTHEVGHAVDYEARSQVVLKMAKIDRELKEARLDLRRADPNAPLGDTTVDTKKQEKVHRLEKERDQAQKEYDNVVKSIDEKKTGVRSQGAEFKKIRGKAISKYGVTSDTEDFAELFALYSLDPELLKSIRPSAHQYFAAYK